MTFLPAKIGPTKIGPEINKRNFLKGTMALLFLPALPKLAIADTKAVVPAPKPTPYELQIRLLVRKIQDDLTEIAGQFVFQPNDDYARHTVRHLMSIVMDQYQGWGMVNDWRVTCDKTNNLQDGELNVDLYFKPRLSIDIIRLQAVVVSSGTTFPKMEPEAMAIRKNYLSNGWYQNRVTSKSVTPILDVSTRNFEIFKNVKT